MIQARVWYTMKDGPSGLTDCPDFAGAFAMMSDFMSYGWYRMDFYMDGSRTHIVRATDADEPAIMELCGDDYLRFTKD
jgi:hypothetical protein